MARPRKPKPCRRRVGQVSYYPHHGSWHLYYREDRRQVRRRVADNEQLAAQLAAQVNAQLSTAAPTLFSFTPVTIPELRQRFLDHHEHILRSSLATVSCIVCARIHHVLSLASDPLGLDKSTRRSTQAG